MVANQNPEGPDSYDDPVFQPPQPPGTDGGRTFLLFGVVYIGMIMATLLASRMGWCDRNQPFTVEYLSASWWPGLAWGTLACLPLFIALLPPLHYRWSIFDQLSNAIAEHVVPLFSRMNSLEIIFLAILVGFGEEMLFRWCLQGWLEGIFGGVWGSTLALFSASALFGICHWVNTAYAWTATLMGLYLGILMKLSGTWLAPTVTHAIYDAVVLLYVTDRLPWRYSRS